MKRILQLVALTFVLITCGSGMPQPAQAAEESPWELDQQASEGDIFRLPETSDAFYVVQQYQRGSSLGGDPGCQITEYNKYDDSPRQFFPRFRDAQYIPYFDIGKHRAKLVCVFDKKHPTTSRIDVYLEK